jgi:hypothetical protein
LGGGIWRGSAEVGETGEWVRGNGRGGGGAADFGFRRAWRGGGVIFGEGEFQGFREGGGGVFGEGRLQGGGGGGPLQREASRRREGCLAKGGSKGGEEVEVEGAGGGVEEVQRGMKKVVQTGLDQKLKRGVGDLLRLKGGGGGS